jgi:hypothetical protein
VGDDIQGRARKQNYIIELHYLSETAGDDFQR